VSDDIEQVRIAVERDMATSGRDEASAALSRVESRLRDAEAERDDLAGEQGRYLQEWQQMKAERDRLQGMLEQAEEDLNVYLQQTIDVKAENARLRDAEAERDRQERYIESLEAERHQWKAGTFPGWTRDDVYKELVDKYRELEAERDELRGALERAIARQAPEGTGEA
jgi:DNA repair exonuclease SbcCD ATPase subunit